MSQGSIKQRLKSMSMMTGLFVVTLVGTSAVCLERLDAVSSTIWLSAETRSQALQLRAAVSQTRMLDPQRAESSDILRETEARVAVLTTSIKGSGYPQELNQPLIDILDGWNHYDGLTRAALNDGRTDARKARTELARDEQSLFPRMDNQLASFIAARDAELQVGIDRFHRLLDAAFILLILPVAQGCIALFVLSKLAREVVGRLRELEITANAVASGDLSRTINAESDDEVGRVMRSFGVMLNYLRRISDVAHSMSNGDLRETVRESSSDDALGKSINRMIYSLREIVARVHGAADSLSVGASQISANSSELSRSSHVQVTSAEQTSAAIEQMAAAMVTIDKHAQSLGNSVSLVRRESGSLGEAVTGTTDAIGLLAMSIRQVAAHVTNATAVSNQASRSAIGGETAVAKAVAGMHEISDAMSALRSAITTLDARSQDIGAIVSVIDDIADQTNLLALNAAIEAARAGDAGRGFAVVADEVRKLSDLSAGATKKIGQLIATIQHETSEAVRVTEEGAHRVADGVRLANDTGTALSEIRTSAERVAQLLADVSAATDEQATTSEHIVAAARDMTHIASQVLNAMVEMNSATDSVSTATTEQRRGTQQVVSSVEALSRTSISSATATQHVAVAAEALTNQAKTLQELVAIFKLGDHATRAD